MSELSAQPPEEADPATPAPVADSGSQTDPTLPLLTLNVDGVIAAVYQKEWNIGKVLDIDDTDGEVLDIDDTDGEVLDIDDTDGEVLDIDDTDGEVLDIDDTDGEEEFSFLEKKKHCSTVYQKEWNIGKVLDIDDTDGEVLYIDDTDGKVLDIDDTDGEVLDIDDTDGEVLDIDDTDGEEEYSFLEKKKHCSSGQT
ncbi:transcription initiation factor TFIID subunit 11-like [Haliotis rubra]|uniref:transcription initiation factor TFIID subunit 11-like n=1 Tax=Haliotis rubra TaxID=36100 RepID=UPI001EE56C7B|nr:transcription initiation factor TFIID subunit 11-like [Haliotis rubra]